MQTLPVGKYAFVTPSLLEQMNWTQQSFSFTTTKNPRVPLICIVQNLLTLTISLTIFLIKKNPKNISPIPGFAPLLTLSLSRMILRIQLLPIRNHKQKFGSFPSRYLFFLKSLKRNLQFCWRHKIFTLFKKTSILLWNYKYFKNCSAPYWR